MGQSAAIICVPIWDLASLSALVEVAARDAGASPTFAERGSTVALLMVVFDEERSPMPGFPDTCKKCTSSSAKSAVADIA